MPRTKKSKQNKQQTKQSIGLYQELLEGGQLQCSICIRKYDLLRNVPYMICNNQHSVCKMCLKDTKKCPQCREVISNKKQCKINRFMCTLIQKYIKKRGYQHLIKNQYEYRGQAKSGIPQGKGYKLWKNGTFQDGTFEKGQLIGKCVIIGNNGFEIQGIAEDGMIKGTYNFQEGLIEGIFNKSTLQPIKIHKKHIKDDQYEGQIRKYEAHGKGKLKFKNGNTFQGEFIKDQIKAKGKATINGKFQIQICDGIISIPEIECRMQKK